MNPEHLAAEAERLLRDPVLLRAVASMRAEALEDLAVCDPTAQHKVISGQARVFLCDEFLQTLRRHIEALSEEN